MSRIKEPTVRDLLARIEADLETVSDWKGVEDATLTAKGAASYRGNGKAWVFLVVGLGESIRDGTAVRRPQHGPGAPEAFNQGPMIVHLTRDVAAKAYEAATKAAKGSMT